MKSYDHIDSVYKRDTRGNFIVGDWSAPEFDFLQNNPWIWTEKVDGTNIRIMWDGKEVRFGGKTDNAQLPAKLVSWLQDQNIELDDPDPYTDRVGTFTSYVFRKLFGDEVNVCLYGEGYGAGIQKGGGNYSPEQKFVLFDVKVGLWWLQRDAIVDIASKLEIDVVPLAYRGETRTLNEAIEDIKAGGFKSQWGDFISEGLVGQPSVPLFARNGNRVITKVKVVDFKNKEKVK